MSKLQKILVLTLLVGSGLGFFISTKVWTLFTVKSPISCTEIGLKNLDVSSGEGTCEVRNYLFGKYYSARLRRLPVPSSLKFGLTPESSAYTITGQLVRPPVGTLLIRDGEGKLLWSASDIGTSWSSSTRELIPLPEDLTNMNLTAQSEFDYELIFTPKSSAALTSHFLSGLTGLLILSALALLISFPMDRWQSLAIVATGLAIVVLWCGIPFGSSGGWFDPGDDKSYMHWTYNLGYLLDPFLTHGGLSSWAGNHNHHTWGTGLVLAPFMAIARLKGPGLPPGTLHFGLMNVGVVLWGCVAVFVLFRAFNLFSPARSAALMALFALVSTSMLKWMFMRNFFSHVPEFLAVSIAAYFAIRRYFKNDMSKTCFWRLMAAMWLLVQIRREDVALFGVLISYEWLMNLHDSLKPKVRSSMTILGVATFSIITLMATNYFTQLNAFFGNTQTHKDFHIFEFSEMMSKNGADVFWRESFGLFYWKNAYPWLALCACVSNIKAWRYWAPLLGVTVAYLLMCCLFEYPNGFEWQGRFLLKLTPVLFGGALYFLNNSKLLLKVIGWSWMIAGAWMELVAYSQQLPKRMNFYISDFSDSTLMYPQSWSGPWMSLFYLPLIIVWGTATFLWLKYYREINKAHSVAVS